MGKKFVYLFKEGNADMRELLGGKGANLAEMTNLGLPVPQGFTITTEACTQYYEDGRRINDDIQAEIMATIPKLEEITGKKFGDEENPLLVSVRSGARASMPGMMDTILNLGLNERVVNVIAEKSNNPRWAWDCYRRFIQMFSDVVMEVGKKYFEQLIDKMKEEKGVKQDVELTADDLKTLAGQFKAEYKKQLGKDFPDDPKEQLFEAIKAVFRSWDNPRANVYRRDNDIPYSWGTAVNVQAMAFGDAAVAAISIANKLYMLVRNIVIGIGHGFQPIAGYCFGAKRYSRVKAVFWRATIAATVICAGIALGVFLFREPIMMWFRDDPEVVKIGSDMLAFLCVSIPMMGYSTFVNQLYQSLGFAFGASFLASCRQGLFFLPLVFLLPVLLGVHGIESVQATADVLTFLISIPFHIYFFKKHLGDPDAQED